MKVRITKPDGTIIEAEGTPEECAALIGDRDATPQNVQPPVFIPMPYPVSPAPPPAPYVQPWEPTWIGPTWYGTTSGRLS